MPKSAAKTPIRVTVDIKPGPASPLQKQMWRRFWQYLIMEVNGEAKNG